MADNRVIRLRPYHYIHVLDMNTNVTHVECGPKTFIRKDHQQVVLPSTQMINIPPRSYCIVANPHMRDDDGNPILLENNQVRLTHGETQVRLFNEWTQPFPLYPGETLKEPVTLLRVVSPNTALKITALRDYEDLVEKVARMAGDQWLFYGPGTYIPRVEAAVVETVVAQVIKPQQALKIKAMREIKDQKGKPRSAGEEWLHKDQGTFLPGVYEQVVGMVKARVLTEKKALHLHASHTFTDVYGVERKAGTEWLITNAMAQTHICDVYETVIGDVTVTTLTKQQYCVVLNPVNKVGTPQWGKRELRKGEASFFLLPGEKLERGVQTVEILGEEEALLLRANEAFTEDEDDKKQERTPGEEWMIYGPRKYVPPVEVRILERRRKLPLDENEGIYVRDKSTGSVFTVKGQTYMLKPNEELWNKVLPPVVEELLHVQGYRGQNAQKAQASARVPHKVVTYRVPHNAAVQLYDYKVKTSRVVFGPELVMLEPDEEFSIMSLSGSAPGEPKRANAITSLALLLGPDFMNDTVVVETSDHARLKLLLSYNWVFQVDKTDEKQAATIFSVRDFVGDTCKAIASRVRGAVAAQTFDHFHKHSADIIRQSVFGQKDNGELGDRLLFSANLLCVTNVDIQSVEPVEQRTRDALQKSVQLAIEIATASQEALANHEAQREEQVAEGKMQRQKIEDQAGAERERKTLVELKAKSAAVESTGQAKAEAIARSEAALIKGRAAVKQAELKAQASRIRYKAKVDQTKMKNEQEVKFRQQADALEIEKQEKQAKIEAEKFAAIVSAIGADTIEAIARAGPEMQAKLLEGLGLQGFLVTDGTSPVNLFNTAAGLVNQ
jgi:major vault protein